MIVLGLDPGTAQSALVEWDGARVLLSVIEDNSHIRSFLLRRGIEQDGRLLAIEQVCSYGMPVGREVFDTVFWAGRFAEAWVARSGVFQMIPRLTVKTHLCHSARAKDANVRRVLIDRFGPVGTKKHPGPLYGISTHKWAALAVAVTAWDHASGSEAA